MILVKTPFRVSLVGGGTDLPEFYRLHGHGAVVSAAIDKYMYVMIHPYFHDKLRVKYSQTEDVTAVHELKHPIVRECLMRVAIQSGVEIASIADIPAGLGLGSSSAFTVGLLHALHAFQGKYIAKGALAEEACRIEIERLSEPIGKQDQYAASHGGLNHFRFNADGSVERDDLMLNAETTDGLMSRLLMFYVGTPRAARDILTEQRDSIAEAGRFGAASQLAALAEDMRNAIKAGRLSEIGAILHEGWLLKKSLASLVSNAAIDEIYAAARDAGARGGKLLGAGGGGFVLFYCEPEAHDAVRARLGLRELRIQCDRGGSRVIYHE